MSIHWTPGRLVAADHTWDWEQASDRDSRFGAYLRQRTSDLRDCDEPLTANEFAAAVWTIANAPVMSPGYVRLRPDIDAVTPAWSQDGEGRLMFDVHVRLPHSALPATRTASGRWNDWQADRPLNEPGPYRSLWEPSRPGNALLTTTVIRLLADDSWGLHGWDGREAHLLRDAQASVLAIACEVNDTAGPAVAALRGDRS